LKNVPYKQAGELHCFKAPETQESMATRQTYQVLISKRVIFCLVEFENMPDDRICREFLCQIMNNLVNADDEEGLSLIPLRNDVRLIIAHWYVRVCFFTASRPCTYTHTIPLAFNISVHGFSLVECISFIFHSPCCLTSTALSSQCTVRALPFDETLAVFS